MKIEFDIPDEKVKCLNPYGKEELTQHCKKWSENIVDEASRIEATRNENTYNEITAAIIKDAVSISRNFPFKKKKRWWVKFLQIIALIFSLITGGLFDLEKFNKIDHVIYFVVSFTIAIVSTVYLTFNTEQNG